LSGSRRSSCSRDALMAGSSKGSNYTSNDVIRHHTPFTKYIHYKELGT
jgi:hypothetical protein